MPEAYIIDAVRTPRGIGKPGKGALSHCHPQHLGATVLGALRDRNGMDTPEVDDIIWSTSIQRGLQGSNLGRMSALLAGFDMSVSGMTIDRFCGGGITATGIAAGQIMAGLEDCIIAGGTEMMSLHPAIFAMEAQANEGRPYGTHGGNPDLLALHPFSQNGVAADAIAAMEGITRADTDAFALESQQRAARAIAGGRFGRSIVPVRNRDGGIVLGRDEYPRPGTTAEGLAALEPSFGKIAAMAMLEDGTTYGDMIRRVCPGLHWQPIHHAGSSSGIVDGSAALLLASAGHAARRGWTPRARIVASVNMGDSPTLSLNAPVPAARKALDRAGLATSDIDVWEVNEAFAVVAEKFIRDLRLDRDRVNINGGAIALGHPIGATGAILIGTALDELERSGGRYALITMCAAGGMAPAIIIERVRP
ncbi:acetyl-CoA C-acetyltransferase [Sphingobium faniae]|nr:acetyl-CoA C-acetyltransferase [Sphingobium faniae]